MVTEVSPLLNLTRLTSPWSRLRLLHMRCTREGWEDPLRITRSRMVSSARNEVTVIGVLKERKKK